MINKEQSYLERNDLTELMSYKMRIDEIQKKYLISRPV